MTDHHGDTPHDPDRPGCSRAACLSVYRLRIGHALDPTVTDSLGGHLDDAREALTTLVVDSNHRLVGIPRAMIVTADRLQAEPELAERIGHGSLQVILGHINVATWIWLSVDTTCAPLDEPC